jgi:transcription elongation factor Elf1
MITGPVEKKVRCPWCGESMHIIVDFSGGSQSYVEDCQVCCQPMQVDFEADGELLLTLQVGRA